MSELAAALIAVAGGLAGGLVGDFADIIVLTKNQAVLVFKLAGLYGRNLHDYRALALEIAPVIGGRGRPDDATQPWHPGQPIEANPVP